MGLRLARNLSPWAPAKGLLLPRICLAQPKRKRILRRSAPYNDTMTDTARLGVSGFTLRDFLGAGCSDLVVAAPSGFCCCRGFEFLRNLGHSPLCADPIRPQMRRIRNE
jgi:hypothetical protein